MIDVWRKAERIKGVKHIFMGSGVRYDLLNDKASDDYLRELCASHVSGILKVAPEHSEDHVLDLMRKPLFDSYENFVKRFEAINATLRKRQFLVNYFITAHPGTTLKDALDLALVLRKMRINPEQIQDYIPLPMTVSGAMYYIERDPFTHQHIYVAKKSRERRLQRALAQPKNLENKRYVIEALRTLGRMDLMKEFYG
jgi:uncharacterized radical SAM protein YgiQ